MEVNKGFDLQTIGQVDVLPPEQVVRHLRRQESLNKFGVWASESRLDESGRQSDEDDAERGIGQTTIVIVVYEDRHKGGRQG